MTVIYFDPKINKLKVDILSSSFHRSIDTIAYICYKNYLSVYYSTHSDRGSDLFKQLHLDCVGTLISDIFSLETSKARAYLMNRFAFFEAYSMDIDGLLVDLLCAERSSEPFRIYKSRNELDLNEMLYSTVKSSIDQFNRSEFPRAYKTYTQKISSCISEADALFAAQ